MNKNFWKAAAIRAIKTICQTAVATIGTAAVISDVDWKIVISASILAGILSILTSVATGLPEVNPSGDILNEDSEEQHEIREPEEDGEEL